MGKIFLSCAEEDNSVATDIADRFEKAGCRVYFWQDTSQRGKQFIQTIENEIYKADAFVAILSPHFLTSPWCTHERDFALRKAVVLTKQGFDFLYVIKVSPVDYLRAGFLGNFDWYDYTSANQDGEVKQL